MISVGIDVSKEKSTVCIISLYGEVIVSPYEMEHTPVALEKLSACILSLDGEVRVVLEATGIYHLPLVNGLREASIFVSVINPLVMKRYSASALRKGKTDKIDSMRIANYGIDNWFRLEEYQSPEARYEDLRMLGRQYSHYIEMRIDGKLALLNLLDRTMPGVKALLKSNNASKDKLCDFVEEYWHYDNIVCMSEGQFAESYMKWAKTKGYHANAAKAKMIYNAALRGISTLKSSAASTKMLTLEAVRIIKETNKTLDIILTQMQNIAKGLPEYSVVREMPGVGEILAPRLIAEIGDVCRFRNGSSLVAYSGIDAPPFQSGNFNATKRSISKRGSSLLRKTGYEVMKCLKTVKPTTDAAVYAFMLKKEAEGKPKKVAKIAALNKFLRIYYARVKEVYQQK